MRVHAWLFRQLLHLYPRRFRAEYAAEMVEYFVQRVERARATRGVRGVLRVWLRSAADVVHTAYGERRVNSVADSPPRKADPMMVALLQDLQHAVRRLVHTPLFTLAAVLILAIGIGLNAAVFSLVDAMVLRPAPFPDAESFVHVYQDSDEGDPSSTSYPAYLQMKAQTDVFAGVAASSLDNAIWESPDGPRPVAIEFATASYFPVLGLQPSRGRWFSREHDQVGAELVGVVSHHAWRTKLNADPTIVGSTIRLNNQPVTIIGIGPAHFNGEAGALLTDFWLSISSTPVGGQFRVLNLDRNQDHWYQVKARLAEGVSVERAQAAMDRLALHMGEVDPETDRGRGVTVFAHDAIRFHPDIDPMLTRAGIGLFTVAGLVLLLACANLANLLIVRGIARRAELAVRLALGAARARIVRMLVSEALLLAVVGAVAGLTLAALALRFVPLLPVPIPGAGIDVGIDARVITFGVLLTIATALLFGLLPALRVTRADVASSLREEGRGRTAGQGVSLLRNVLVGVQVAVSVVLVVGAGLFARSLINAQRVDPGFDADRIAVLATDLQQAGVDAAEAPAVLSTLLERIRAVPGVEAAAVTTRLPVQRGGSTTQVVDGYTPEAGTGSVEIDFAMVSRDYFETMGMRFVEGRGFNAEDRPQSTRVVIVNQAAARAFWGDDAVGGRIRSQSAPDAWRYVVGVVEDAKVNSLSEQPTPMMYYSAEQVGVSTFAIVARTGGSPRALLEPLRNALREVRSTLPVTRLAVMDEHLGDALAGARVLAAVIGAFSILALLLASVGVYAVVAFGVERRTQELGIRSALGARGSRLIGMVVVETLTTVALGIAAGLWLAIVATRSIEGLLFGVRSFDLPTFGVAAVLLLTAAAAAAFLPARRAARTDPVEVLRHA